MHSTAKNKITQNPLLSISETNKTWRTAAGVETSSRLGIAHSPAPDFKSVEPDKGSGFDTPQKGAKIPQSAATQNQHRYRLEYESGERPPQKGKLVQRGQKSFSEKGVLEKVAVLLQLGYVVVDSFFPPEDG